MITPLSISDESSNANMKKQYVKVATFVWKKKQVSILIFDDIGRDDSLHVEKRVGSGCILFFLTDVRQMLQFFGCGTGVY